MLKIDAQKEPSDSFRHVNVKFIIGLVVWLSGNALVVINEVTLRQARLILGWVDHLGM